MAGGTLLRPVRLTQPRQTRGGTDDPAHRTLNADPAASSARPCGHRPAAVRRQPRHAARASPRPAAEAPAREKPDRRAFRTASYSVLHSVYLPTPEPPGPGECAGSARNKPSGELPDLFTRKARKTIVTGAPACMMTLYLFSPWYPSPCLYILSPPTALPSRCPGPPPRGRPRGRTARQAGRARRPAAGGKGAGKRRPAGRKRRDSGRYRQPRLCVTNCESPKLARKFPEFEAEMALTPAEKGELASLLYPEIPGGIPPAIKIPGNGEKRAHANAGPYSASHLRR